GQLRSSKGCRLDHTMVGSSHQEELEPMVVERALVDLDAEAGPAGQVQHAVAQLALGGCDGGGEETLGGEAVGEVEAAGRRSLPQRLGHLGGGCYPDRAVEGAGDI